MTSLLSPSYELTLGSQRWTEQVVRLRVTLALAPQVNMLTASLPAAAPFSADIGDDAILVLDSGEKKETVFRGIIDSIRRGFEEIRITCLDAGGVLARFRPSVTYEQVTASTVIRNLAGEIGVATDDLADGPKLSFYVADPSRTAWEHAARLSAWGGAVGVVSADNKVRSVVLDASQAEFALRYGREIMSMNARSLTSAVESFTVAGESGTSDGSAPEALRPTTDFFAGSRPAGPGPAKRWRFEPALRTAKNAGTAGAALFRNYGASREGGFLRAFPQPRIRCGTVLEIQDLPGGLPSGPIWAAGVEHRLGQGEAATIVHFRRGGDAFDPMALLGSLMGAVGGLL